MSTVGVDGAAEALLGHANGHTAGIPTGVTKPGRGGGVSSTKSAAYLLKKKQFSSSFSLPAESKPSPDRSTAVGQRWAAELYPGFPRRAGSDDLVTVTSSFLCQKT